MISPDAIVTFAQYREDIILLALLHDVENGFYVDVGANYATADSVTKLFYDRGWQGINIEPLVSLHKQLAEARPRDINLNIGASQKESKAVLREYVDVPGHSTFDKGQMVSHGKNFKFREYEVDVKPLRQILNEYAKGKHINFMKIDVEGYEYQVVAGADWRQHRPEILCIEANHVVSDWRPLLAEAGYKLFIQDGLNEYYVVEESWARTNDFAERAVKLDASAMRRHQVDAWRADLQESKRLQDAYVEALRQTEELTTQIQELTTQTEELTTQAEALKISESLSLKGKSLRERVKRAVYGLTVDWYRFKRQRPKKS